MVILWADAIGSSSYMWRRYYKQATNGQGIIAEMTIASKEQNVSKNCFYNIFIRRKKIMLLEQRIPTTE
jgi:translation elongation factor EF-4